ncbi:MAG: amidohydrolase, partial [Chloroflexi bacterium]|nr:amidohydrolase [Chloroflexota bacterium]
EVNTEERLGLEQALTMHSRPVDQKGRESLRARQVEDKFIPADLVLLDRPLNENEPEEILKTKVAMTIRGGEVVYEA